MQKTLLESDKLGLIKTGNFCSSGDIIKKINKQAHNLGEGMCTHISDKEVVPRRYKDSKNQYEKGK